MGKKLLRDGQKQFINSEKSYFRFLEASCKSNTLFIFLFSFHRYRIVPSCVHADSTRESLFIIEIILARADEISSNIFTLLKFAANFFLFLKISVFKTLPANRAIIVRSPILPPGSLWAVEVSFSSIATPYDDATSITFLIVTMSLSGIIPPLSICSTSSFKPMILIFSLLL